MDVKLTNSYGFLVKKSINDLTDEEVAVAVQVSEYYEWCRDNPTASERIVIGTVGLSISVVTGLILTGVNAGAVHIQFINFLGKAISAFLAQIFA